MKHSCVATSGLHHFGMAAIRTALYSLSNVFHPPAASRKHPRLLVGYDNTPHSENGGTEAREKERDICSRSLKAKLMRTAVQPPSPGSSTETGGQGSHQRTDGCPGSVSQGSLCRLRSQARPAPSWCLPGIRQA